jgi:ABC-2 type transport system ATP-binding protein
MNQYIIRTQNLTRDFETVRTPGSKSRSLVRAVDSLTLEIPQGIVFGFLGPNGSGKTTTIRLLLGLLEPTQGSAEVFGFDTRQQAAAIRERTGALLEHNGLYERLSAEDKLEFYGRVARLPTTERKARIQELLNHMGLYERRRETVGTWSRGMKQKLAIARALMHRPQLIFLDEPTAGLDPLAAAALRADLAQLASDHQVTIFLTTHNLTDAEKLCEQVAVIRAGKLLAVGSPEALRAKNRTTQAEIYGQGFTPELIAQVSARPEVLTLRPQNSHYLLEANAGSEIAAIITQLVVGGAQIEEVRKSRASLEEIFLDLVEDEG